MSVIGSITFEQSLRMFWPKRKPSMSISFQSRVSEWMAATFSIAVARDTAERNHRFLEESLELVQSLGCTQAEAHKLVDYVFGRLVGDPEQEVGGVTVTLAALCNATGIVTDECSDRELARCWRNIEKIRAKQKGKPPSSPLPGPSLPETVGEIMPSVKVFLIYDPFNTTWRVETVDEFGGRYMVANFQTSIEAALQSAAQHLNAPVAITLSPAP